MILFAERDNLRVGGEERREPMDLNAGHTRADGRRVSGQGAVHRALSSSGAHFQHAAFRGGSIAWRIDSRVDQCESGCIAHIEERVNKTKLYLLLLGGTFLLVTPALRAEEPVPWQFSVTPYVWLPHIDAQLGFESEGSGGSTVDMSDVLKHLTGAFFLNATAHKGRWGAGFDFVYCELSKTDSKVTEVVGPGGGAIPINAGTESGLTGYMVSLTGSYALSPSNPAQAELIGGVRYTHIGATLDWSFTTDIDTLPRTGSASTGVDLWDGIVGVRGNAKLGESAWFVPYYLDAGTGTSTFTWQAVAGIGYSFHWGDLLFVYRYLSFEQGSSGDVKRLSFAGPALGATFRF